IFKYPAVEYIPLYPLTLALEPNWKPSDGRVNLYVFTNKDDLEQELIRLGIVLTTSVDFSHKLVLLTIGYQVTSAYYRGYTTILQGEELPGGYHVAAIPRGYFYKNRIHFALYDKNARKLAWANITLTGK
ncbi:MAG: hypothetical protein GX489_01920, partial [Firmicutes bacterium]|nr:hypothetical protein [Bacillota bacterium]